MLDIFSNGGDAAVLIGTFVVGAIGMIVMATLLAMIWRRQSKASDDVTSLRNDIAGLQADQKHYLTAKNLGPLHEKINDVAREMASLRAEQRAATEQLRLINRYLMGNK